MASLCFVSLSPHLCHQGQIASECRRHYSRPQAPFSLDIKLSRGSLGLAQTTYRLRTQPKRKPETQKNITMAASTETPMPNLFDGTTRLYLSPFCPYTQRVAIATNYKQLDDIERVEINLSNKPHWFAAKVYPPGKVPALEHGGKVIGESMDLLTYLDENFSGPKLLPEDEGKKLFAKELYDFVDELVKTGFMSLSNEDLSAAEIEAQLGPLLERLDKALAKYSQEGPFFLGEFSAVDCVFIPFLERFSIAFMDVHKSAFDVTQGRPNLSRWLQAMDGVKAYADTKVAREQTKALYERMLSSGYFKKIFGGNKSVATTAA